MKTKHRILIHLAFWVYMFNQTLLTIVMVSSKDYDPFGEYTLFPITSLITFYPIYFMLGPVIRQKKKLTPVIILVLVTAFLIPLRIGIEYLFWKYIGYNHLKPDFKLELTPIWWFNSGRMVLIYGMYALLINLAVGWYESQKLKSAMLVEKQTSELALLRSQVNPHFLFNTLNNIYSLVYKKSDDAPEAIMKMSAIMRYMLYDATTDKVLLEKEIEYLKSFIELEKLRIRHRDFVELTVSGVVEDRTIAPMLLIPFVENAFKHGSKNMGIPGIWVNLQIEPDTMRFEVVNYIRPKNTVVKDSSGGIGLTNIRRRLNLLYPGKHQLDITSDDTRYHVYLTLMI